MAVSWDEELTNKCTLEFAQQNEVLFAVAEPEPNPFAWVLYDIYKELVSNAYEENQCYDD